MTLQGTVKNGVVVLDPPAQLADGTRVRVLIESAAEEGPQTAKELLMKYAGCMTGLPSDLARNHDHYIHGTPKR
jgi:hypothetical protein